MRRKARQNEIGAKVDQGSLVTSVSLFQITRPSGQLSANRYAADGEQRNRGIEVNAYGKLGEAVRLSGGASWTDAELVKTNSAATLGKTAVGVPRRSRSLPPMTKPNKFTMEAADIA